MNNTIKCGDGHLTIHLVHAYATTEDHSSNIPMKGSNAMLIAVSMIQQISNTVQWTLYSLYCVSYTSYSEK